MPLGLVLVRIRSCMMAMRLMISDTAWRRRSGEADDDDDLGRPERQAAEIRGMLIGDIGRPGPFGGYRAAAAA